MKLLFVGDIMLGRLVNQALKHEYPEYPWGDTLPFFKNADLRICNLECVISDVGEPFTREKAFHFRTDEKNIRTLLAADIGIVSIANNHALDYGYDGMVRMMEILGDNAVNYAGVGTDLLEAVAPAICKVNRRKVGLIAFTDNEPNWQALDKKPGIFYAPIDTKDKRAQLLIKTIKKTRSNVDILIVSAHWGPNWGYEPPKKHIPFAHALIDSGADIVFGHSGHVFRGIEIYKKKVILYCTGDFIDDYAVDEIERNDESFVFLIKTDDQKIKCVRLYPTVIGNFQARKAKDIEEEVIIAKMKNLCSKMKTDTIWNKKGGYLEITV